MKKTNALKELAPRLADDDEDVRNSALTATSRIGGDSALKRLLSDSSIDEQVKVRVLLLQPGRVVLKDELDRDWGKDMPWLFRMEHLR